MPEYWLRLDEYCDNIVNVNVNIGQQENRMDRWSIHKDHVSFLGLEYWLHFDKYCAMVSVAGTCMGIFSRVLREIS